MNIYQFIIILRSRRRIALWALAITVIMTLVVSLLLPKKYVATTSIVVDQRSIDPMTGQHLPVLQLMTGYMATQAEVIASHNVARKVVENLKLSDKPQMQEDFANAEYTGDIRDWSADLLLKNLQVKPARESSLIHLDFTSTDPKFAAIIANAFADAYIQTSIELRAQPAKLSADWLHSQMASLREDLGRAQSVLSTYEQQYGIVEGADRQVNVDRLVDLEQTRLGDLSNQLVESQARTNELQSRKNLLASTLKQGGSLESLQEVLSSPLIQSLRSDLARSGAHLAELSQKFKKGNSQYRQAEAQVASLQQEIKSATKMVLTSIDSGVASSKQRDEMLTKALAEQKAKVMDLKKKHDQIAVYIREVENAQRAYDEVMHRAVQTRMESEMSQADISILNPAIPPPKHAKPKMLLNMILSVFLGGMLGVGMALLAELMDRRVRSVLDVSELLAVPVFAVVSATAAKPKRIARLFNWTKQVMALSIEVAHKCKQ
ncbi:MAG: chain length determinant protein EpsF [Methylococcales bacterium]|nr:chain length determinant protein EpsF [Methylococcales bacterium]